ncbi:hypothetical protein [Catenulispora yoronensis]|uniref:hypothetical protein n=1 Tax=Catenulispora yoronensis TaxID=450799 RepID=UPI0031DEB5D9
MSLVFATATGCSGASSAPSVHAQPTPAKATPATRTPRGRTSGPPAPLLVAPTAATATASAPSPHSGALYWIVGGTTLNQLRATDAEGTVTTRFFDTPHAYLMSNYGSIPRGWTSTPTASFTSYATMQRAVTDGTLDPHARAVLYDNERWWLTPAGEQADPARYYQLAATLAHRHSLLLVATPGVSLAAGSPGQDRYSAFLASGLIGSIARVADAIDLQAQGTETNLAAYRAFVVAAAAQARQSNPAVVVLAGISTSSDSRGVDAATLVTAIRSVRSSVDGFWLNDPARSQYCPTCVGPFPQVALSVLATLARDPGIG